MKPQKVIFVIVLISLSITLALFWLIYAGKSPLHSLHPLLIHLPTLNACLNTLSASSLTLGIIAIKNKKIETHKKCMLTALVGSTLFLIGYILYHCVFPDMPFQGQGWIRPIYFFILITHIILTSLALPFILATFVFAFTQNFTIHKKLARWTAPMWLYVSITGVLVFLLLRSF